MSEFKWTNESLNVLIESYRSFECLWNPKHKKYKCRNAKEDAWAALSVISGAEDAEVKRKIKNLIGQFFRERKKYGSLKKSGAGAYIVSKWFAYDNMMFLADKNKPRRCTERGLNENIEDSPSSSENYSEIKEPASPMQPDTENLNCSPEDSQTPIEQQDNIATTQTEDTRSQSASSTSQRLSKQLQSDAMPEQVISKSQPVPSTQHKTQEDLIVFKNLKARKRTNIEVSMGERQEEAYKVLKELKNKKPRSRFQVFGEHVGLKIESLSTECAKNTVEHLISNILWEAAMGKYDYGQPMIPVQETRLPSYSPTDSYSSSSYSQVSACSSTQFQITATPEFSPSTHAHRIHQTIPLQETTETDNNPDKNVPETEHNFSDVLQEALHHAGI